MTGLLWSGERQGLVRRLSGNPGLNTEERTPAQAGPSNYGWNLYPAL